VDSPSRDENWKGRGRKEDALASVDGSLVQSSRFVRDGESGDGPRREAGQVREGRDGYVRRPQVGMSCSVESISRV
jgi:hypothetical protein